MAECGGRRRTTVYLRPGLTGGQRKAALRRLRQEASRGYGPALRGPELAVALAADRFRIGVRNTAAVVRLHPAGSLLPAALAGALMTLFVLSSVSARVVLPPQAPGPGGMLAAAGGPAVPGSPAIAQVAPGWAAEADRGGAGRAGSHSGAGKASSSAGVSPAGAPGSTAATGATAATGQGGGTPGQRTDKACGTARGGTAGATGADGADSALTTIRGQECGSAPAPWQAQTGSKSP